MKKGLILTLATAAIMWMGTSPLHAGNTQVSPQDDETGLISMCIIQVGAEHWEENVQEICEFIGVTQQAEWEEYVEEYENEQWLGYGKTEYSSDGKYKYNVAVVPFSSRYASVMITVFGEEKIHGEFTVPDTSNKTMAGMCAFSMFPDSDHEKWDNDFWDTCNVLGIDVMESEWSEDETEYGLTYNKTGFDEKGKNMYRIYMVPPIDEGDLCAVAIMKWAL